MDSWTDLLPGVRPAVYAYKCRHLIQHHWKKLQVSAGFGTPTVMICGRSGVGKSVLAAHYHGEANKLDWHEPGSSPDVEIKPIAIGSWTQIVSVVPGQNTAERAKALDLCLNRSDTLEGIIYVVDWGYTTIRSSSIQKDLIQTKQLDTVEKFRERNITNEIEDFRKIADCIALSLTNGRGPKWLVIALSKIDLFESKLDEAKQHYHPQCSGAFSQEIKDLYQTIGKHNLRIECLPVCVMPEPFQWGNTIIKPEIDSVTTQRNYLRSFIDKMSALQRLYE